MFYRLVLRYPKAAHKPLDGVRGKYAHEAVLQRYEKPGLARVALAARAAAQLVVDAARLVPLGTQDKEPAQVAHLLRLLRRCQSTAQLNIGAAAGHVGGDRYLALLPRASDYLALALVIFCVKYLVGHALLPQECRQKLIFFNRDSTYQDRLALLMELLNGARQGLKLAHLGLEDEVVLVQAHHRLVGGYIDNLELVDLVKLLGRGLGGAGHAGELVVQAEVVLVRNRGVGARLLLHRHILLGLDGLVQAL